MIYAEGDSRGGILAGKIIQKSEFPLNRVYFDASQRVDEFDSLMSRREVRMLRQICLGCVLVASDNRV